MSVKIHKVFTSPLCHFAQFVGFYTAHMIWSLEEGDNVAPLLAFQKGGKSWFERFESHTYEEAVNKARERFEAAFLDKDDYALLAFDGYLTHEEERK